jgi:heme exporter protein A
MLTVTDLSVARGGVTVLSGLSLGLGPGEALVLRGPNGIGKTTLLRCVAGLQPPVAGRIEVDEDSTVLATHSDGIKAMLTVTENLEFWAAVFGTRGIDAALEAFDLTGLRNRLAGQLSAGQKRRLGLARLLVANRPLWVLDEPTVSLDAASVGLFASAVRAHLARGGAALLATHIDLGLEARVLDLTPFKARDTAQDAFAEDWA